VRAKPDPGLREWSAPAKALLMNPVAGARVLIWIKIEAPAFDVLSAAAAGADDTESAIIAATTSLSH
jgi:hypothetical protein